MALSGSQRVPRALAEGIADPLPMRPYNAATVLRPSHTLKRWRSQRKLHVRVRRLLRPCDAPADLLRVQRHCSVVDFGEALGPSLPAAVARYAT